LPQKGKAAALYGNGPALNERFRRSAAGRKHGFGYASSYQSVGCRVGDKTDCASIAGMIELSYRPHLRSTGTAYRDDRPSLPSNLQRWEVERVNELRFVLKRSKLAAMRLRVSPSCLRERSRERAIAF
jgi:hypothetical protein